MAAPNPYSPPQSQVDDVRPGEPDVDTSGQPRPRRPISAWLLLLVLSGALASFVVGFVRLVWLVAAQKVEVVTPLLTSFHVGWRLVLGCACVMTIIGIFRARKWSRWVGLVAIAALGVGLMLTPDTTVYPNEAQQSGAWFGHFIVSPALFVWWAFAFAFSQKAVRYFFGRIPDAP